MRKQCKHIAVAGKLEIVDVRHDGLRLSEGKAISPIRAGYGHLIEKLRTRQSDIGLLLDEECPRAGVERRMTHYTGCATASDRDIEQSSLLVQQPSSVYSPNRLLTK